jgi:hypothetical protein
VPRNFARWVAKEIPGYQHDGLLILPIIAFILTVGWIMIVRRANRSNRRAIVNWTSGLTAVWLLANGLGLSAINYASSYRAAFAALQGELQKQSQTLQVSQVNSPNSVPANKQNCIAGLNIGDGQRALLRYHADITTIPRSDPASRGCAWFLVQTQTNVQHDFPQDWREVWRGNRPGDKEQFRLYLR